MEDIHEAGLIFKKNGDQGDLSNSNAHFIREAVQQFEDLMARTERVRHSTSMPE